jgi:A/G-specific adenine glycosylase
VQRALLSWYATAGRDLPWRRTRDPYAILVSEVMLQQTQVARVVPHYEAWLERWPDARALAAAPPADVLRAWIGLGYNRRALRLREACRVVARDGWPRDPAALRSLPGVGPYTAAAVASFAFGESVACVDTNVARVVGRLGSATPQQLVDRLPAGAAPTWNQAVMELGATVCRAREAHCGVCPVARWCVSRGHVGGGARARRSPARGAPRWEQTNRWVRGRIVAALARGEALPPDIPDERLAPALEGLVSDGLVRREGTGFVLG